MTLELVRIALGGLVTNRLRSFLTMLSICIGVFSVISLMAVGAGASAMVRGEIESFGSATTITVYPTYVETGYVDEFGTYVDLTAGQPGEEVDFDTWEAGASVGAGSVAPMLTEADLTLLREPDRLPSVLDAVPVQYGYTEVSVDGVAVSPDQMFGTSGGYDEIMSLDLAGGVFVSDDDVRDRARVAVVGSRLAATMFPGASAVGGTVEIGRASFDVVGVLAAGSSGGFGFNDNSLFMPITSMQDTVPGIPEGYESLLVEARSAEQVDAAKREVAAALHASHGLRATDPADVSMTSNQDQLDSVRQITLVFQLLAAALASISLLVGGIGVMNIMLVTVTERTREIGIRKAIGARHHHLLGQFLLESVTLCLVGGLVGIALGSSVSLIDVQGFSPVVTPFSVVLALTFSLGIGLAFGIYPAHKAASLRPVDALRYE